MDQHDPPHRRRLRRARSAAPTPSCWAPSPTRWARRPPSRAASRATSSWCWPRRRTSAAWSIRPAAPATSRRSPTSWRRAAWDALPGHRGGRRRRRARWRPADRRRDRRGARAELKARLGAKRVRVLGVTDFPAAEGRDAAVDAARPARRRRALAAPARPRQPLPAACAHPPRGPGMTTFPDFTQVALLDDAAARPAAADAAEPWETPEGVAVKPRYGAADRDGLDFVGGYPGAGAVPARHPRHHVRHQPVDHPSVRGLLHRRGVQRLLPAQPRGRPDGPVDRLRPRHPPRLRLRPPARDRRRRHGRASPSTRSSTCAPCSPASRSTR